MFQRLNLVNIAMIRGNRHADFQRVEVILTVKHDLAMRRNPFFAENRAINLRREKFCAAHDNQIIRAASHPAHSDERPPAFAAAAYQTGAVAGAIAEQRKGFFRNGREHQFPFFADVHRLKRRWVNHLHNKMIFVDMQAVSLLAFPRHARSDDFRQAVVVIRRNAERLLDFGANLLAPGF